MTKDPLDAHLGARLQSLREARGLSMSAVGREIKTTYQQVRKYETGENRISASTLFRLAQLLDVEVGEFFKGMPGQAGRLAAEPADGGAFDHTLDRIEDRAVRQHMSGLLKALGGRR
jgi:transcriptional regulator with XRE-family HTH domain